MSELFENKVYMRELKEAFGLEQVAGGEDSLDRWTIVPDVNRPGLELAGFMDSHGLKRVNILGNKESRYINMLDPETARIRFEFLTDVYTPCIIVTGGNNVSQQLIDIANQKRFPVFRTDDPTYAFTSEIVSFLAERLAKSEMFYGELVQTKGVGVLIMGESGMGKSEVAMEIIKRGGYLVADDNVVIKKYHNRIFGEAPEVSKGLIEVRGIGIIDAALMFGAASTLDRTSISLAIRLVKYNPEQPVERVGKDALPTIEIMGVNIPYLEIPVFEGRSTTEVVEAAILNYRLMTKGIYTATQFKNDVIEKMKNSRG